MINLTIPGKEPIDLMGLRRALEAAGATVSRIESVSNYRGSGPATFIDLNGMREDAALAAVDAYIAAEPPRRLETFVTLTSPNGAKWRIGVNDRGEVVVAPAAAASAARGRV